MPQWGPRKMGRAAYDAAKAKEVETVKGQWGKRKLGKKAPGEVSLETERVETTEPMPMLAGEEIADRREEAQATALGDGFAHGVLPEADRREPSDAPVEVSDAAVVAVSVADLTELLEKNPFAVDTYLQVERGRQPKPRRGALQVLRDAEARTRNEPEVLAVIDALMAQ